MTGDMELHPGLSELCNCRLTLATLCDMVLDEDQLDRSDDTLIRAVGMLKADLAMYKQTMADCADTCEELREQVRALREACPFFEHFPAMNEAHAPGYTEAHPAANVCHLGAEPTCNGKHFDCPLRLGNSLLAITTPDEKEASDE